MTLQLNDRRIDLARLKEVDSKTKPTGFDADVAKLIELYEDSSLSATRAHLKNLGVGLKNNARPLQASLLRYVVHRIAVVYERPPNRFLQAAGARARGGSREFRRRNERRPSAERPGARRLRGGRGE